MRSWLDFERRFREISEPLRGLRLDFQWGAAGEHWRLAGMGREPKVRQFEGCAILAGQLLERCFDDSTHIGRLILSETIYTERWYRAIKELSGEFDQNLFAIQQDKDGNNAGYIYSGSIQNVVEVAANVCLHLQASYPLEETIMEAHSIIISDSTIGIVNTGILRNIETIKLNISTLQASGLDSIANALQELAQAVETSTDLTGKVRSEVLDQLEELSRLANEKADNKVKPGVVRAILTSLGTTLSAAGALAEVWSTWGADIREFFGL